MKPLPKKPTKEGIEMDYTAIEDQDKEVSFESTQEQNCLQKVFVEACSPKLFTNAPFLLVILANLFSTMGVFYLRS